MPCEVHLCRGADNNPDAPTSPGERFGYVYEINYLRCIHCDLCVEACPTQAITESKLFEFSFTNRSDAIYTKNELLVGDDGKPQQLPWEDWRDGEDTMTSGWMRATSPAGDHRYEGIVHWAGELGYGVTTLKRGRAQRRTKTGNSTGSVERRTWLNSSRSSSGRRSSSPGRSALSSLATPCTRHSS